MAAQLISQFDKLSVGLQKGRSPLALTFDGSLEQIPPPYRQLMETIPTADQTLNLIADRLRKLRMRAELPVTVSVMGHYSVGKSSLLNCILHRLIGAENALKYRRETADYSVDKRVTYITHPTFRDRLHESESLGVVTIRPE